MYALLIGAPDWFTFGFYFGGATAAAAGCTVPTPSWVSEIAIQGWLLTPIWDDLQAPCNNGASQRMSYDLNTAESQGSAAGSYASQALATYGFGSTLAYLDIEAYNKPGDTPSPACTAAVRRYIQGWVERMQAYGNSAGVYTSFGVLPDIWGASPSPDIIWFAKYDGSTNLYGYGNSNPSFPDNEWSGRRIKQFYGNHATNIPGTSRYLSFDWDVLGGMVVIQPW